MNVATILKEKGRNVVTAKPTESLLDIVQKLEANRIGCIVILDENENVCGIISERDVVRTLARCGRECLDDPVERHMTRKVMLCQESDTIEKLMSEMTVHRFRHLPVVDGKELIGIVSIGDVVKQRLAEAEMEAAAMRDYIATG